MAFGCQTSSLAIRETKAFLTKLLFQDSILFDQELDRCGLLAVDSAGTGCEQESKLNGLIHTRILRDADH